MGLRLLSIGSVVADTVSVATLAAGGMGSEGLMNGLMLVAAAALPTACVIAGVILRRMDKPTLEIARQMAGFDANFLMR